VKSGALAPTAGIWANAVVPARSAQSPRASRLNAVEREERREERRVRPFRCMQRRSYLKVRA